MKSVALWSLAALLTSAVVGAGTARPPVAPAPRPVAGEVSLLVIENVETPGVRGIERLRLLRVGFRNGIKQPPEPLWEGPTTLPSWGRPQLVHNRYLVTAAAAVFDVVARKEIRPGSGTLVAVSGDEVAYRVEHAFGDRQAGVYTFDLKTHATRRVGRLGEGKYGLPGKRSPDGTKSVANDEDEEEAGVPKPHAASGELILYRVGQPPRSLGKDFSVQYGGGPFRSHLSVLPLLWLDDERIVTQVKNGELITVSVDGTRAPLVSLPATGKRFLSPTLGRDPGGRLIYWGYGGRTVVVDVKNRTWEESKWADLGHGFEASETEDNNGRLLRYKGQEIGRMLCLPRWAARTTDGYLAIEVWPQAPFMGGAQELRVWSAATGKWSALPKLWPDCVIGWMK